MSISLSGLVVIGLLIIFNSILGTVVILRNPKAALNRTFLLMTACITLWAASSNLSDITTSFTLARYASFIAFGSGFLGFCAAYLFSEAFRHGKLKRAHYIFGVIGFMVSLVFATPLVYNLDTLTTYHNGVLYFPYILSCVAVLALIVRNFVIVIRHGAPQQRNHARFIVGGFVSMAVLALITNAIIPALVDVTWVTKLGPAFTTVFIASIAYSMIKHRLFDMRLAVARTLAYVMTLVVVAGIYAVLLLGVLSRFINMTYDSWVQQVAYVAMAVVLSSTFQPIKRFFDRITNRLFYQDAYDSQEFLAEINRAIVNDVDIDALLEHMSEIIIRELKTEFVAFDLRETAYVGKRIIDKGDYKLNTDSIERLEMVTARVPDRVVSTLDSEEMYPEVYGSMIDEDVSVAAKLSPIANTETLGYGLLIIGAKKSGNQFTKQDLNIIRIIAGELSIAVQNALRYEEIEKFNVTLQEKVDDATRRLKRTNDKLKAMDETKDEFISMASHQLRTPLTSVKGYLSMVLEGDAGDLNDMQRKLLGQAFVSSQRMVFLIADLLNLSRLRTGKFIIEATPTNLADVIEGEVDQLKETAASRGLTLDYHKPETFSTLMLDETKIRQVIMNFVDNAIYYTPTGGEISIELKETAKSIEFVVHDNGIGVPKSEQPHLFSKFYRAKNAQKARPDGTGLGLFMAKKVIVAQGGAIIFDSKESKGSTFGFSFGKAKLQPPASAPADL